MKDRQGSRKLQLDASLLDGVRLYAIGDIHGRLDLLERLMSLIEDDNSSRDAARTTLIFLGDYVDRGPDSKGVVEWLINVRRQRNLLARDRFSPPPPPFSFLFLKGNHEHLLLTFLTDPAIGRFWLRHGGVETLLSYGVDNDVIERAAFQGEPWLTQASEAFQALLPNDHLRFYRGLELCYRSGDYLFVHAGVNPKVPLNNQSEKDLLWIRDGFVNWPDDFAAVIVHGHTPGFTPVDLPTRIGIDTYAVDSGRLTALGLEGYRRWFLST
jgi:serine/threonine protein phosphatase 1